MTVSPDPTMHDSAEPRPSLLPFDPADLVALRVSPAQFARMCEVSKQSVSQWIKQGKVTLGPDGKLDPAKAAREVFAHTDPARLRARVFKSAMESRDDLRERVNQLQAQLAKRESEHADYVKRVEYATRNGCMDAQALQLAELQDGIAADFDALASAYQAGTFDDWIGDLIARIFYPDTLAEAVADDDNNPEDAASVPPE